MEKVKSLSDSGIAIRSEKVYGVIVRVKTPLISFMYYDKSSPRQEHSDDYGGHDDLVNVDNGIMYDIECLCLLEECDCIPLFFASIRIHNMILICPHSLVEAR